MNYLLDTNVISELIARAPSRQVIDWIDSLDPDAVYLSVITIGELRKGIEKLAPSRRKDELTTWLDHDLLRRFAGHLVDITTDVMLVWGELTGRLERDGKPIAAIELADSRERAGRQICASHSQRSGLSTHRCTYH